MSEGETNRQTVFYNPIQQFNRDLSVLAIKAFTEDWVVRRKSRDARTKGRASARRAKKRRLEHVQAADSNEDGPAKISRTLEPTAEDGVALDGERPTANDKFLVSDTGGQVTMDTVVLDALEGPHARSETQAPRSYQPRVRILDALSATGLRALRYAKEIPSVSTIVANDMNPNATKSMALNIEHNGLGAYITPNTGDAIGHMYSVAYPPTHSHGPHHVTHKYEVIDLDPYGTAAPFLDAALQALSDGGLLCVTCTDSGVFASCGYSEKTFSLYGGLPAKSPYMHEAGLRLIINSIASAGAKYGLAIEPLLSLSIDFYARTFIRVRKSPAEVKFLAGKTMIVYACDYGCGAWTTQLLGRNVKQTSTNGTIWYKHLISQAPGCDSRCQHCGSKTHIAGPMWAGPLHNAAFVEKILSDMEHADPDVYQTKPRIEGMLHTALEELLVNDAVTSYCPPSSGVQEDAESSPPSELVSTIPPTTLDHSPFFFNPSAISKVIHAQAPPDAAVRGALRKLGYRATRSHCAAGSIKTDAPWNVLWEIMREWVRQRRPVREGALREGSPGWRILQEMRSIDGPTEESTNGKAASHEGAQLKKDTSADRPTQMPEESDAPAAESTNNKIKGKKSKSPNEDDQTPVNRVPDVRELDIVFDEELGRDQPGRRLVRYQMNPRENWGPMARAKGKA